PGCSPGAAAVGRIRTGQSAEGTGGGARLRGAHLRTRRRQARRIRRTQRARAAIRHRGVGRRRWRNRLWRRGRRRLPGRPAQGAAQGRPAERVAGGRDAALQARIGISSEEGRMGEDSKLIVGAMGTTCQEQEGMLKCEEADNAPNALGRSKGTWINPKVTVMVRLYRADPDNPSADPSVLSEDVYSVSYVQTECKDPGAAAAKVARLVGGQTLLGRAVNVDFPTSPRALNCNPR